MILIVIKFFTDNASCLAFDIYHRKLLKMDMP